IAADGFETVPSVVEPIAAETFYEASEPETAEAEYQAGHIDEDDVEMSEPAEEEDEVPVTIAVPATAAFMAPAMYADEPRQMTVSPEDLDDGYYITVIEEKNGKQRNMLLLASAVFCLTIALAATVISLFDKDLGVGAIDDGKLFSAVIVDDPMMTEEIKEEKKNDKKAGGGGGGGREDKEDVSQGDLADQSPKPTRPPDAKVPRMDNFELVTPPPQTEGNMKFPKNYDRWGNPTAKFGNLSNGMGSGGGMGSGVGTGQGSGRGTGAGSGSGSGYGSGNGNGNGDGDGDGVPGSGEPPPKVAAVTTPLQIISKPKATYTDAARTNNVQGSVRLKITLLASGAVGSITPVTRLPHGLTEQAIAAARQIRFKPKMINGVAQSVVVTFDYGFNIY
ncbi:MAG: energy transducer TonB, partial [Pyrinomonadaceae bacterium]